MIVLLDYTGIPQEVVEAACRTVIGPRPESIHFVPKATTSRGEGWEKIRVKNPATFWLKCHTQNYWAWVDSLKPNPYYVP